LTTPEPPSEQALRPFMRVKDSLQHGQRSWHLFAAHEGVRIRCRDLFLIGRGHVCLLEPAQRFARLIERHVDQVAQVVGIGSAAGRTSQRS